MEKYRLRCKDNLNIPQTYPLLLTRRMRLDHAIRNLSAARKAGIRAFAADH